MSNRYKPYGPVKYAKGRDSFFWWGQWPEGYNVTILVRDVIERGCIWPDGCHRVVITGPQPRPPSKTFIGESAWNKAENYAGDAISTLQRQRDTQRR
jgi:hypothetical protein